MSWPAPSWAFWRPWCCGYRPCASASTASPTRSAGCRSCLRLSAAARSRGTSGRAVGVHQAQPGSGKDLGDPRAGQVAARVAGEVDDQVREVTRGLEAVRRHDRAARVARGTEAGPAVTIVVPVRREPALELALADRHAVAVAVMQDRRRAAAGVDALRSALWQLRVDRKARAYGDDRVVVADPSVHELRDRADVRDRRAYARRVNLHVDVLADLVDAVACGADEVRAAVRVDEVGRAAVREHLARAGADDTG